MTGHPLLPPGYVCTAFWYATHRGLPVTMGYLQELGLAAARTAHWLGIAEAPVAEGPFWCHQWPERIWDGAAARLAAGGEPGHGYQEAGDYG